MDTGDVDIFGPDKIPLCSGKMFNQRAVFLDRDGTVIESVHRPDFVKKITAPFCEEELKFVPRAYLALSRLKEKGLLRILVTDQPDVAHGYMEEKIWQRIQNRVKDTLGFDDIFICRHLREDNCPLKKPSPLMLQAAADKWGIDLSKSWMVGDTNQDMQAGRAAGCKVILIDHFYPPSQKTTAVKPWMNANGGPSEARRAKEGASADSAEEMKGRLHNSNLKDSEYDHRVYNLMEAVESIIDQSKQA